MELIGIIFFFILLGWVVRALKAFGRTALGKGTLSDNLELAFQGMQPFQIQTRAVSKGEDGAPFDMIVVEGKGLIPTDRRRRINFVTSVIDTTGGENSPVWSHVDEFQEPETIAYQHAVEGAVVDPDQGLASWARVGLVLPEILVPPRRGNRDLMIVTRIVDGQANPQIRLGFGKQDDPAVLATAVKRLEHRFEVPGYEEIAEERDRAHTLAIELGVAVAMSDGRFDEQEAKAIARWIEKLLAAYSGARREALKQSCNNAFRSAYEDGRKGILRLGDIANRLGTLSDESLKWEAIELGYDVLAADGVAATAELETIRKIASFLRLDVDELQKIKDQRLVGVEAAQIHDSRNIESVLGIDPRWSTEEIRQHLRAEFRKWNGRINTLTDPAERESTQKRLDLIAEARRRYG